MATKFNPRYLVVSIGNPLPKYESLHSAGHFAIRGLAKSLPAQLPFSQTTLGNVKYLVSRGPKYTLVQSPTLMNVSGNFVSRIWKTMVQENPTNLTSLVVLHDELEKALGDVRLIPWSRSARGHNGIKSCHARISEGAYPGSPFARIAIGIGRPVERDPDTVAKYVLKQISPEHKKVLEDDAPRDVLKSLEDLESQWKQELGL